MSLPDDAAHLKAMENPVAAHDRATQVDEQLERWRKDYNAAVANGLMLRARQIDRRMKALADSRTRTGACPEGHDRKAGRWCAICNQHGSHHTDRHDDFLCCYRNAETHS